MVVGRHQNDGVFRLLEAGGGRRPFSCAAPIPLDLLQATGQCKASKRRGRAVELLSEAAEFGLLRRGDAQTERDGRAAGDREGVHGGGA